MIIKRSNGEQSGHTRIGQISSSVADGVQLSLPMLTDSLAIVPAAASSSVPDNFAPKLRPAKSSTVILVRMLQKIANPEFVVRSVPLEIAKDILASVVAGLITYSICAWQEFPLLLQPACITIAGYGGSRVLERYLAVGIARIDRLGGKPEGTP